MVHAGPENAQPSLAAQRVIARERDDDVFADQRADDKLGEQLPQVVDVPHRLREKAMVVREVPIVGRIASDNQVGNVPMPHGKNPASHQQPPSLKARISEDRRKRA